jgi:hypothetical protein
MDGVKGVIYEIRYDEAFFEWIVCKFVNGKRAEVLPFRTKEDAERYVKERQK